MCDESRMHGAKRGKIRSDCYSPMRTSKSGGLPIAITLPGQAVRLDKIVTGTYNVPGNYKVVYKTNLNPNYRTMYDNLSTQQNYVLDASKAALGMASNEYVTEFMVSFGVVPANFRQVEAPQVYATVYAWLTGGSQFVNQADVGGVYNGQWIMATSRWVTRVYKPSEPLPRTGY